jgi:hypothetical protein
VNQRASATSAAKIIAKFPKYATGDEPACCGALTSRAMGYNGRTVVQSNHQPDRELTTDERAASKAV